MTKSPGTRSVDSPRYDLKTKKRCNSMPKKMGKKMIHGENEASSQARDRKNLLTLFHSGSDTTYSTRGWV